MPRPCIFFDRDGVINEAPPPGDYLRSWSEFRLIESVVDWIRLFNTLGYLVVVVTNQRGIARGLMTVEAVEDIHRRMMETLAGRGARIDDVFYCPHERDAGCDCRKPLPGMVRRAAAKWDIDMERSAMIGDSKKDEELARACGMTFIAVAGGAIVDQVRKHD